MGAGGNDWLAVTLKQANQPAYIVLGILSFCHFTTLLNLLLKGDIYKKGKRIW